MRAPFLLTFCTDLRACPAPSFLHSVPPSMLPPPFFSTFCADLHAYAQLHGRPVQHASGGLSRQGQEAVHARAQMALVDGGAGTARRPFARHGHVSVGGGRACRECGVWESVS
eukprot:74891-Chlamydomonas_euryale.AAC.3